MRFMSLVAKKRESVHQPHVPVCDTTDIVLAPSDMCIFRLFCVWMDMGTHCGHIRMS